MGRPPLNPQRTHLSLNPVIPPASRQSSATTAFRSSSERSSARRSYQIAPGEEKAGPLYLEINGDHEPRLSVSGRATVFAILRKKKTSLDELQCAFGFEDSIDFIHALVGHRPLPNQAAGVIVAELLGKLWQGE